MRRFSNDRRSRIAVVALGTRAEEAAWGRLGGPGEWSTGDVVPPFPAGGPAE